MIRKGDVVKIKPEWQDEGDSDVVFIAIEDQMPRVNGTQTVAIQAQLGLPFNPVSVVSIDMLETE